MGVAAAADVVPERFPARDRAVETDERLLPGAHDHPRIRQAGGGHGHREQQRERAEQPLAGRQRRQEQAGQRQHHQRPVVGETQTVRGRRGSPDPRAGRVSDAVQNQGVGREEQQRVERIDLGDDRLRPDVFRRAEQPRRGQRRQPRRAQQAGAHVHRATGTRPEDRTRQVTEHRGAAEGKLHEQMTEQRVEGIAGRMRDAELRPGHQEQAVVFQHDAARQRGRVQQQRAEHGRGRRHAVARLVPHVRVSPRSLAAGQNGTPVSRPAARPRLGRRRSGRWRTPAGGGVRRTSRRAASRSGRT